MKKIILAIGIFTSLCGVMAEEYIDVPISVIIEGNEKREEILKEIEEENKRELQMSAIEREIALEKEKASERELEQEDEEVVKIEETEKRDENKKEKMVKVKKKKKSKRSKIKINRVKLVKKANPKRLELRGNLHLPGTIDIDGVKEYDSNLGFGGGVEYTKPLHIESPYRIGGGAELTLMAWDKDKTEYPDPGFLMIPIYFTGQYEIVSREKLRALNNTYFLFRGGYNIGIAMGDAIGEVKGGTYYGIGMGKHFGDFTIEMLYSVNSNSVENSDWFKKNTGDTEEDSDVSMTHNESSSSRIGINFGYNLFK